MKQETTLSLNVDRYKNELIELCKNFESESEAARPINSLTAMLNNYINNTEFHKSHIVEITSEVTRVVAFLCSSCELARHISEING